MSGSTRPTETTVFVRGGSGMGKTALLQRFLAEAGEYNAKWFDPKWKKNPDDAEARADRLWNEADAKAIIAALQKGEKFETLADRSKDTGSKAKGGDLDWNSPANFVKPFSDAMVALPKGKFTTTPVQTQFGWHVILVEDIREAKIPSFDEVKPQLTQRMQGLVVEQYLKDLRAKNGY